MQNILKKFLQINNYDHQEKDFEDYFLSHPNYPSLYAVTDTLTLVGIENVAAKIPQQQFFELPASFLATYRDRLVLVEKTSENIIITKEDGANEKLVFNDFVKNWDGVVVAIGMNEVENLAVSKSYVKGLLFSILSLFFIVSSVMNYNLSLNAIIGFALLIGGLFLSILIIEEKHHDGNEDSLITKICSFNENLSCNSVIKSKQALFLKGLDFSDLPILFFTTAVIVSIVNANFIASVGFLCLFSLPIVMYSIWLQKAVLQKWCLLCLSVGAVIICTAFFGISFITKPNWNGLLLVFMLFSMVSFIWFNYRNLLMANTNLIKSNRQLLHFKRNPTVYNLLKKPIHFKEQFHAIQAIEIGNNSNPISLTLVLSPSCSHCHKAYEEGLELIANYPDTFRLSLFFNLNPENYDNPYLKVVFNLLQIHIGGSIALTMEALNDWHVKRFSLEKWIQKWDQGNIDESVLRELGLQYNWCQENDFNYTPVKIVNESLYPQEYTISELRFFITQLEEELEIV
jgi:uncharacterized membrane protein